MSDAPKVLSRAEAAAAKVVLAALADLDAEQAERVLAHVQDQLDEANDVPVFARTAVGPYGKLNVCLKTWLDEPTSELFRRLSAARGQESSACNRDSIYLMCYRKSYTVMVAEKALHDADAMDIHLGLTGPFAARESGGAGR